MHLTCYLRTDFAFPSPHLHPTGFIALHLILDPARFLTGGQARCPEPVWGFEGSLRPAPRLYPSWGGGGGGHRSETQTIPQSGRFWRENEKSWAIPGLGGAFSTRGEELRPGKGRREAGARGRYPPTDARGGFGGGGRGRTGTGTARPGAGAASSSGF